MRGNCNISDFFTTSVCKEWNCKLHLRVMTTETFKGYIKLLQPKLQAFAMHILRDEYWAEDVTQEVFAYLWQNIRRLDGIDNLEAYCINICKCRCIDHLRSSKSSFCCDEIEALADCFSEDDEEEGLYRNVLSLMERLPQRQRIILKKKYLEAKTTREIVEDLNMSEANVRTNISRAYAKLREMMNKMCF